MKNSKIKKIKITGNKYKPRETPNPSNPFKHFIHSEHSEHFKRVKPS